MNEVLLSEYPTPFQPPEEVLQIYDTLLSIIVIDITRDTVKKVATKIQGAEGPGGVNSMAWHD
eukprot:9157717-Ditylum_brightwellii.AAC.1